MTIIFFGSFRSYSVQILEKLTGNFSVTAVITAHPRPAGRHMEMTKTEVQMYSENKNIPVFPLESLEEIPNQLERPDFLVVSGYGKLIPNNWLSFPKIMAINMHPSLLPHYRGRCPAEWAILRGEKETGATLVKMSPEFDRGEILVQQEIPIEEQDTHETLYTKLYDLGANLLAENLPGIAEGNIIPQPQPEGTFFYARQVVREDGFIPWEKFKTFDEEVKLKHLALCGWPGAWTEVKGKRKKVKGKYAENKRLKLITLEPEAIVQLEGKKPVAWKHFCHLDRESAGNYPGSG